MDSNVESSSTSVEQDSRSLGVRFAESTTGSYIVAGILFIVNSFWLMVATVGLILTVIAAIAGDGVMAGITGVFGLSGLAVGVFGYVAYLAYIKRQDTRS